MSSTQQQSQAPPVATTVLPPSGTIVPPQQQQQQQSSSQDHHHPATSSFYNLATNTNNPTLSRATDATTDAMVVNLAQFEASLDDDTGCGGCLRSPLLVADPLAPDAKLQPTKPQHNNTTNVKDTTTVKGHENSTSSCYCGGKEEEEGNGSDSHHHPASSFLDTSCTQNGSETSCMSSVGNPSIFEQLSAQTSVISFSSVPDKFLRNTPENKTPTECVPDVNVVKQNHQEHLLALAPIITDVLADTIKAHEARHNAVLNAATTPEKRRALNLDKEDEEGDDDEDTQAQFIQYETGGITSVETLFPYVQFLLLESWASTATFVGALILMDRFVKKMETPRPPYTRPFRLTFLNAFKLFVAASRIASKVLETRVCDNRAFAKAGRISVMSVNLIEERFLNDMDFDVNISKADWEEYAKRILTHSIA